MFDMYLRDNEPYSHLMIKFQKLPNYHGNRFCVFSSSEDQIDLCRFFLTQPGLNIKLWPKAKNFYLLIVSMEFWTYCLLLVNAIIVVDSYGLLVIHSDFHCLQLILCEFFMLIL